MTGLTIIVKSSAISGVWTLARDLIQYNVVGTPGVHQVNNLTIINANRSDIKIYSLIYFF